MCGVAYSLQYNREWIENRILMILDKGPCHGYELHQSLPEEAQKTKLTTIYRWLHDMETEALVESEMEPGPHGPQRRVYRLGQRGETRLREVLRDSIENVLHFYDGYRHAVTTDVYERMTRSETGPIGGRVLFTAFPKITNRELDTVKLICSLCTNANVEVLGNSEILKRNLIKHSSVKGDISDIHVKNETYSEIWLNGVPERKILPRAIAECKRVLISGGRLRMTAPFVFFEEPTVPTLGEFLRVTAAHLFPELGIVDGNEVGSVIESHFKECGAFETFPSLVEFWATKDKQKSPQY
jgi:DNA-binding PadR family transcriptional regulator